MRILVILLCALIFLGCEVKPEPLSWSERKTADSIYSIKKTVLEKELDSICAASYDDLYQSFYDSLYQQQIKGIDKLKKKSN